MFWSRCNFFKQSPEVMAVYQQKIREYLLLKGYTFEEACVYLKAYDYFCKNPAAFDGATIVKDLIDVPGLDLDAMLHDYQYLVFNVASNVKTKWKADWLYAKSQERKGKGQYSSFSRFVGLTLTGVLFVPYTNLSRGCIRTVNKRRFLSDYDTLMK